ncbi:DUF4835 family protein [Flavisolibacter ginsenosidimutans]|uniref:DUF4835 family protein n=1 Tax=Flavisolibacter ginsenosidimutans TaxID=661481 RepID=A0A5B8UNN3_9BACT|nr:DUF4835 family protein [Flavisolibacter ginsenosidimutans]QEC58183.1 DUF4835 family protein [Flavisolibacter ginsenosidimutans]
MRTFFILVVFFITRIANAQELQAKFTVLANRVSSQVDKKTFQTLQTTLTNFVNNRKWTPDAFQPQEKIRCNFLLNIEQELGNNQYKATLTVQAARPAFNSNYFSPIINFQDNEVVFQYIEFQPVEFNENRVQGNDAMMANLPAVIAYYVNLVVGMDYDSFGLRGGDPYFQKAQYIVNNAPEGGQISGWKAFDGLRNRYKLIEGLVDSRYALMHDAIYAYYRGGLDNFFDKEKEARLSIFNALNYLNTVNRENPNSMILQFFFQGKGNELVKVFSKAEGDLKTQARDLLVKLDVTNTNLYKELR